MARKSRKTRVSPMRAEPNQKRDGLSPEKRIPTAIYARLSWENNGRDDDDSIKNQVALIHSYILEHPELELIDTYVDNGFTGTNFDRPEFMRLMDDVNHGKISCIVVKDLSRFGRNYVETGVYIENIFPKMQVRLIAVNDHFDSSREGDRQSITVPVKNMVNEMYSRDQSRKITTAFHIRRLKRDVLPSGHAPFGYRRNKEHTKLLPDENADCVRVMYQWKLMGVSISEITERLDLAQVPLAQPESTRAAERWRLCTVTNIIKNPVYAGDICFGKQTCSKFAAGGRASKVPKEQWIIHKDTHEPLVPRADYEKIMEGFQDRAKETQKNREETRAMREAFVTNFADLVFCGECNRKMFPERVSHKAGEKYTHVEYQCRPKEYFEKSCYGTVAEDFLKVVVMDQVRIQVRLMADKAAMIRQIKESGDGKDIQLSIDKKIAAAALRLREEKEKKTKLYEDYKAGLIDEGDFRLIHETRIAEVQRFEGELKSLTAKKDVYIRMIDGFLSLMDQAEISPDEDGYDGKIVEQMVERIMVFKGNRIEIIFKHGDVMEVIEEALECDSNEHSNVSKAFDVRR